MELHPGEEIIYNGHPSWRSTWALYGRGVLGAIVLGLLTALGTGVFGDGVDWLAVALVVVVVLCLTILAGFVNRMFTVYTITTQRLRIQRGIIARKVQQTRIERVQNVNTDQGIFERLLNVGDVDFDTAGGTNDADFRFEGVNDPEKVVAAVDKAQREHSMAPGRPRPADGLS
ncbi:MAG: PH domain-containing protein [Solirubrobacteraceae bacterium]|nr:PH domain-containing protein [Solirubrobacteraceae bacterium]